MLRDLQLRLRALFRRKAVEDELDDELRFHLDRQIEKHMKRSLSREEAMRLTRLEFGGLDQVKEKCREARGLHAVEVLWQDTRFALRMLRRNPGFTIVAVITLALGIGANTALFSVVNAVLLRPLPFPHQDRLMYLSEREPDIPYLYISLADLVDWRARNTVFETLGAQRNSEATLTGEGDPQHVRTWQVTTDFFPTLGMQAIAGRLLSLEEDRLGAPAVVVLSERYWTEELSRDRRIIGKQLRLDGELYTVIGVAPSRGSYLFWRQEPDLFISLNRMANTFGGLSNRVERRGVYACARLKPGISVGEAQAQMARISADLARRYPETNAEITAVVEPMLQVNVRQVQRPLLLLMAAVGLVLLIACANVANLLTALNTARRREIAVRAALGAGTARLARQFLCESLLLAMIGGAAGLLVAYSTAAAASAALAHLPPGASVPRSGEIAIDHRALVFTFAVSLLAGIVFGVFPALAAYRTDPNLVFKENGGCGNAGLLRMDFRNCLIAVEVALSLILLVGAGLTIKSLFHLLQADPGFQTDGVLTASLKLPDAKYRTAALRGDLIQHLVNKIAALGGVSKVGFASPLFGPNEQPFLVEGRPLPPPAQEPSTELSRLTPGTLEALGVKLLQGRFFNAGDSQDARRACIIDDMMALTYWPGESVIGKRIQIKEPGLGDANNKWWTVTGLVRHVVTHASGGPPLPNSYLPYAQVPANSGTLVVHSSLGEGALTTALQQALHALDPDVAWFDIGLLAENVDAQIVPRKLAVALLSILASLALLLAAVGTYGAMAYMVTGRAKEIGVRRALGAAPADVLRLVLGQGMAPAVVGLVLGILVSLTLGRLITPILFGVKASDPVTFASVGALLLAVALAACYVPARRAMRLNPLEAIRHE
jgi:putative ABC transport system permease protein